MKSRGGRGGGYPLIILVWILNLAYYDSLVINNGEGSTCNGLTNLCDMPVNEVLFGMVHNAMSSPSAGFLFFANHINDPIVESLDAGFRGLSLDLCNCGGTFEFCHGGDGVGCGVGRRDPTETFRQINAWLSQNPNNVLLIDLEINEDADGPVSLQDVYSVVSENTDGFENRLYDIDDSWPTLQELIDLNQQVLLFYARGANGNGDHPPGINYFFDHGMTTDYSYESVDDLEDRTTSTCTITRGQPGADLFLINAFVTRKGLFGQQFKPSQDAADEINTVEFSQPLLEACERIQGSKVNVISVDFWKSGNLPELIEQQNAVLVPPTRPTTSPVVLITASPTMSPTISITPSPVVLITASPTVSPTIVTLPAATSSPVALITASPTISPTIITLPSASPTFFLPESDAPTATPTLAPTTLSPTLRPSLRPSQTPTLSPTTTPTANPSGLPSSVPSTTPTVIPSSAPSRIPSRQPSSTTPSVSPTSATVDKPVSEINEGDQSSSNNAFGSTLASAGVGIFLLAVFSN